MTQNNSFLKLINMMPRWGYTIIVLIIIVMLTIIPADNVPHVKLFPHADKLIHALMFGGLAVVMLYDISRNNNLISFQNYIVAVTSSSTIGGIIELFQQHMNLGRSGDVNDLYADIIGTILLPILTWKIIKLILSHLNKQ